MYIAIEGIDTAGKSTQLRFLKKAYPDAVFTKEPGGTKLGLKLRKMALSGEAKSNIAEMFLFLADRAEHTCDVIENNLNNLIISDRSLVSGIAYANILDIEKLIDLNILATNNTLPSHIILLELTPWELRKRLSRKKQDSIESRGTEYLLNIQSRMKKTIKKLNIKYLFINASMPSKKIHKQIKDFINE